MIRRENRKKMTGCPECPLSAGLLKIALSITDIALLLFK
jgi:hypothetical protein